jgi:hypothetical protein
LKIYQMIGYVPNAGLAKIFLLKWSNLLFN